MEHDDYRKIESLKKQKLKADRKGNIKEEADVCNYLGEIYARCERYDEAIAEHERELSLNEVLNDKIGIAVAHRKLGECYCRKGEFQRAVKLHKQYLQLARSCENALEEQRALATIGKTYLDQRDVGVPGLCRVEVNKAAGRAFEQSLEVCERLKPNISQSEYLDMKARLYLNLGLVYEGNDKTELCHRFLEKAVEISKKEQFLDVLYLCQSCLSDLSLRQNLHSEAHTYIDNAIDTARKMKDKQLESDALYCKALINVQEKKCGPARHILKKSHKVSIRHSDQALKVLRCYKTVKKLQQLLTDVSKVSEDDWSDQIPLYDKMGDLTADIGLYKMAVGFYKKMLSASISVGREGKDLAVIHVSIAETLKDDKQYSEAINHYRREIQCRTELEQDQICNSLMSIGVLQEQSGLSYKQIQVSYVDAFNAAKKAKNLKLQVRSLKYLIELFKVNKADKLLARVEQQLSKLRQKHGLGNLDEDSQEETQQEEDDDNEAEEEIEEECVISDLTDSEDELEKVNDTRTLRTTRQCRTVTKKVKLTEFGETPLHKACIAGNLEKVQALLREGHPLNVQDNNGWTPIHEATNNGHYEITEMLIQYGANKDHRGGQGCEGLTPLMDAASAGNFDIMMLLIDKGANINAKDDHQMKALDHMLTFKENGGELSKEEEVKYRNVLQILRERDPGYRSKMSDPKVNLSQRASSALVPESSRKSSQSQKPRSRNDIVLEDDSDSDMETSTRPSFRLEEPLSLDTDSLDNLPDSYNNPHLDNFVDPDRNARESYKQAISEVGRSGAQPTQTKSSTSITADQPALLRENEIVNDDWLINDIRPIKRRKVNANDFMTTFGVKEKRKSSDCSPSTINKSQRLSRTKRRLSSDSSSSDNGDNNVGETHEHIVHATSPDRVFDDDMEGIDQDMDDSVRIMFEEPGSVTNDVYNIPANGSSANSVVQNNSKTKIKPGKQLKLTQFTRPVLDSNSGAGSHAGDSSSVIADMRTGSESSATGDKAGNCVLKVKVHIKDTLFNIPVIESDQQRTFAWLAEEAATRYYKRAGLRPHITLGTKDGAHFSPEDIISVMVNDNDRIEGFLEGWDLPPVSERYAAACKSQNAVVYKNVQLLLQGSETTGKLDLSDLALRTARFQPVVRTIQCQTNLREINIKGNRIGDFGVENLCKVLSTLPNLSHLGLTCNDITTEGLKHLTSALAAETDKPLQSLTSLELSHNPLYDNCLPQLAQLVTHLPCLSHLGVSSCKLTAQLFQTNRLQLTEALHNSSVQSIDISYNNLGCLGIELFLKCQNPTKIQTLDLSACLVGPGYSQMYRHLYNYCTQDKCALQTLRLRSCSLGTEDTDFLTRIPSLAKQLQHLDLSNNPRLTNNVLHQLLQASISDTSQLETLIINHCKLSSPLSVDLLDCLAEKMAAKVPLRVLELTCHKLDKVDTESLGQIWRDKWEELSHVHFEGQCVKLSVTDR